MGTPLRLQGEAGEARTRGNGKQRLLVKQISPMTLKWELMIPGSLGDKSFFDASFRSIEPIKEAARCGCGLR